MTTQKLTLSVLADTFAIVRLERNQVVPAWATTSSFYSITQTADELSIVCLQKNLPADVAAEKDWRAFKVEGPLNFALTGILASLADPLAKAKISIFAISTFDTDYILVKADRLADAITELSTFCTINNG